MSLSETGQRVLAAAVAAPLVAAAAYAGGWWLGLLLVVVALIGTREFLGMAERKPGRPFHVVGGVLSAGFVLIAAAAPEAGPGGAGFGPLLAAGVLGVTTLAIWDRGVEGEPLVSIATTLAAPLYTGALLSYGLFLRHLPGTVGEAHGTALVFAPVLLTWTSDTFAYFAGRAWGTRKLIPRVSPGKTVQGAVGALVGTVAVALLYRELLDGFPTYRIGWAEAALFGLLVSVAAQVGDLVESLLKRDAGVKDSGRLLPGHGGALDRIDSLLFTIPLAYFFFRHLVGP